LTIGLGDLSTWLLRTLEIAAFVQNMTLRILSFLLLLFSLEQERRDLFLYEKEVCNLIAMVTL
jgi:hypothetical protein